MKYELIQNGSGVYEIHSDGKLVDTISRKSGESDDDYEKRAVANFDSRVDNYKSFKERIFTKKVIKTTYL